MHIRALLRGCLHGGGGPQPCPQGDFYLALEMGPKPGKRALGTRLGKSQVEEGTYLRWLDWIFLGRYLPSLSLNYVGMSKDIEKRLPQLYYIKMKISYDLGFIAIGVAMAT